MIPAPMTAKLLYVDMYEMVFECLIGWLVAFVIWAIHVTNVELLNVPPPPPVRAVTRLGGFQSC
jgi:hypothetical protein